MRLLPGASLALLFLLAVAVAPARAQDNITFAQIKAYWGITSSASPPHPSRLFDWPLTCASPVWNEPCDATGVCPWAGVVWDALSARVTSLCGTRVHCTSPPSHAYPTAR